MVMGELLDYSLEKVKKNPSQTQNQMKKVNPNQRKMIQNMMNIIIYIWNG